MAKSDDENEFRLRPRKPRGQRSGSEVSGMPAGLKLLMHYARQSAGTKPRRSAGTGTRPAHRQRCAVRITYSKNMTRGQWGAHGRYLERESAAGLAPGFDGREGDLMISSRLQAWQTEKDELLWKIHHLSRVR